MRGTSSASASRLPDRNWCNKRVMSPLPWLLIVPVRNECSEFTFHVVAVRGAFTHYLQGDVWLMWLYGRYWRICCLVLAFRRWRAAAGMGPYANVFGRV